MSKDQPIKVCFFSKYPPIEGGVSSQTYWMSRALGERGIEVHIITNALEVEENYREIINLENPEFLKEYQPKNVFLHSLNQRRLPYHIPFSSAYLERLINLGVKVIEDYECNIIDSSYIQPYGLAAIFSKLLTSKPCILRHAGSDISRLFSNEEFYNLYKNAFNIADIIVTKPNMKNLFKVHNISEDKLWFKQFSGADPKYFNPEVSQANLAALGIPAQSLRGSVLTYMGKYGPCKGLDELVAVASQIEENFLLLFITGGRGLEEFKEYLQKIPSLKNKYYFLRFLPPWQIPSILRASSCLLHLENDFPIKIHMVTQPIEAFGVAVPTLMSDEIFNKYRRIFPKLEKDRNVLVADPKNPSELKTTLLKIIQNPSKMKEIGERGHREIFDKEQFEKAIEAQISLYQKLLKQGGFKNVFKKILKSSWPL